MLSALTLRGREVALRPLVRGDAEALHRASAESRANYGLANVPEGPEAAEKYVTASLAMQDSGFRMPFAVIWNGRLVGTTSYSELEPWRWPEGSERARRDRPDAVEVGYTWYAH